MASQWSDFQGVNLAYALELYERFQQNPNSVDSAAREWLSKLPKPPAQSANRGTPEPPNSGTSEPPNSGTAEPRNPGTLLGSFNYVQCIRRYGHLAATIDPLGSTPTGDPLLEPAAHDLSESDLRSLPPNVVETPLAG